MNEEPLVGVVMGSKSDYEVLSAAVEILRVLKIPHEARVVSAHRTPDRLFQYASVGAELSTMNVTDELFPENKVCTLPALSVASAQRV